MLLRTDIRPLQASQMPQALETLPLGPTACEFICRHLSYAFWLIIPNDITVSPISLKVEVFRRIASRLLVYHSALPFSSSAILKIAFFWRTMSASSSIVLKSMAMSLP